eukprot:g5915.t1
MARDGDCAGLFACLYFCCYVDDKKKKQLDGRMRELNDMLKPFLLSGRVEVESQFVLTTIPEPKTITERAGGVVKSMTSMGKGLLSSAASRMTK